MPRQEYPEDTILVSGYGRLPEGVASHNLYRTIGVIVVVDPDGIIIDADSTLLTRTAREFLRGLLMGRSLREPEDALLRVIRERYQGHTQGAILAAVRHLVDQHEQVTGKAHPTCHTDKVRRIRELHL